MQNAGRKKTDNQKNKPSSPGGQKSNQKALNVNAKNVFRFLGGRLKAPN